MQKDINNMEKINIVVDELTEQQKEDYKDQINNSTDEAVLAYINYNGKYATPENFEDTYQGKFSSDEDFAEDMASNMGIVISDSWPYNCIDWEQASRELMQDYYEENGHYFRA